EYVATPLGSSSEAPVIRPGPRMPSKRGLDGPTTGSGPSTAWNSGSSSVASDMAPSADLAVACQADHRSGIPVAASGRNKGVESNLWETPTQNLHITALPGTFAYCQSFRSH